MHLDHIVFRTARRDSIVEDITALSGLEPLIGYSEGSSIISKGIRFDNGPFLDIFPRSSEKDEFDPLLALGGNIEHVAKVAKRNGWRTVVQRSEDFDEMVRPPWSTLSFRRGQGFVSSLFIIQYEAVSKQSLSPSFSGPLYRRHTPRIARAKLDQLDVFVEDIVSAKRQLLDLRCPSIPMLNLLPLLKEDDCKIGLHFSRFPDGVTNRWYCP